MRVNIYAEEMTERVEIISKVIDGHTFTGLRLYLELPATVPYPKEGTGHTSGAWSMAMKNVSGPFIHREGDDDSSAVTFWGKRDLRKLVAVMKEKLDTHYGTAAQPAAATDEKGRPMTYWGGLAAPAAAGVSEEPVAWRHPTPHGWVVTKNKHMDSSPLYAHPALRHSLAERADRVSESEADLAAALANVPCGREAFGALLCWRSKHAALIQACRDAIDRRRGTNSDEGGVK